MSDIDKQFHQFALHSVLFKGRSDWYFCFLKSQKIAHVLALLAASASGDSAGAVRLLSRQAARLPEAVARFAAGELKQESILASILSLVSSIRFAAVAGDLSTENASLLSLEYERMAEKLGQPGAPSPFISAENLSVPELPAQTRLAAPKASFLRDFSPTVSKRHAREGEDSKGHAPSPAMLRQDGGGREERLEQILAFVRKQQGASIKDICGVVKGVGEKTIQRELATLIERGLIRREGERRWSIYRPVSGIDQSTPL